MSDSLRRITALAALMREQLAAVADAESQLATCRAALLRTRREDLPELMRELGLSSVKLESGETISVKDDVNASIPPDRRAEAYAWLEDHGYGGILRTQVAIPYSHGEHDQAMKDAAELSAQLGRSATLDESIPPQTLRAFVRERLAAGESIPFDLFGIHVYSDTKIVTPKKT